VNSEYFADALDHINSTGTAGSLKTGSSTKTGISYSNVNTALCGGTINTGGVGWTLGYEIAYNEYSNRLGLSMPYTRNFIKNYTRTTKYGKYALFMNWEELVFGQSL
jgi:hypothetical protein